MKMPKGMPPKGKGAPMIMIAISPKGRRGGAVPPMPPTAPPSGVVSKGKPVMKARKGKY